MKKRNLLALILAVLMLLTLFGACAKTPAEEDTTKTDTPKKDEPKKDEPKKDEPKKDEPKEREVKTITQLRNSNPGRSTMTWEEAIKKGDECALYFEDLALNEYGLIVVPTNVNTDGYETSFTGFVAANTLPDSFQMTGDAATRYSMVEMGMLASMDDVFAYSSGTAYGIYYGGCMDFARATNILDDGNWYWYEFGNNLHYKIDLSSSIDGGYIATFGVFVVYPLMIRQDWLNDLGMAMPQNLDEFYDALLAFNVNDVNGNGTNDERLVMDLGRGSQFECAPADWFGLWSRYQLNTNTGEIMMPELLDGYLPFLDYCKRLYDSQLVLLEEGGLWAMTPFIEGDYVSAFAQYQNSYLFFSLDSGKEYVRYVPLPMMQAVEGIKPTFQTQDTVGKLASMGFNVSTDYEACGRYLDMMNSEDYVMTYMMGIKGKAWDIVDGNFVGLEINPDEDKGWGGAQRFSHAGGYPQVTLLDLYHPNAFCEYTIKDSIAAGRPYGDWASINPPSHEAWVEKMQKNRPWVNMDTPNGCAMTWEGLDKFGAENITFRCGAGHYLSYLKLDEAELNGKLGPDLTTHLNEMVSGFVQGNYTADSYDSLMDTAYSLGLKEMLNMYQTRANRTLEAMGRKTIPLR